MKTITAGFALTGSFCTFERAVKQIDFLMSKGVEVLPIMSFNASQINSRFGEADYFIDRIEKLTNNKVIKTIEDAEPIGPKNLIDVLIILPCTGNTLAKLASGIYDTPVTLAAKSHLRNQKPVVVGVSSNDSLSTSAKNIGALLNYKHYYFVPMTQDSPENKPFSIVCDFERVYDTLLLSMQEKQIEPIIF